MPGPMQTGQFANLLVPGFRKTHFEELKAWPSMYSLFMNVTTTKRAFEEDQYVPGFTSFGTKDEGEAINYGSAKYGAKIRYTMQSYGGGYRITREMWDDDLYSIMKRMNKAHARGVNQVIEVQGHIVMNSAFDAAYPGWPEGDGTARELCHTAHVLSNGATYANKPATAIALGQTALQASIMRFTKMTDENSIPVMMNPVTLLLPADLRFKAKELMLTEKKPDSADNTINALQGEGIAWKTDIFLTSTTAWWLLAAKGDTDLWFYWRVSPEFNGADDFDTGDSKFKTYCRFGRGHGDWRGVDGTPGV